MKLKKVYKKNDAYLHGHFLLSSGNHSEYYLQSAKILEDPKTAGKLAKRLFKIIKKSGVKFDAICSPAIGGILAGYEFARSAGKRFIFTERNEGKMTLRRGFEVFKGERFIICEDIVTTGGSAMESAEIIKSMGGKVVGFAALASRGFCKVYGSKKPAKKESKLPENKPFFALGSFDFEIYDPSSCPLCKAGSSAIKPGSRGN